MLTIDLVVKLHAYVLNFVDVSGLYLRYCTIIV